MIVASALKRIDFPLPGGPIRAVHDCSDDHFRQRTQFDQRDGSRDCAFNEVLTFHFGKIQIVRLIDSKNEILPYRLQLALLRKKLEGLAQVRPP